MCVYMCLKPPNAPCVCGSTISGADHAALLADAAGVRVVPQRVMRRTESKGAISRYIPETETHRERELPALFSVRTCLFWPPVLLVSRSRNIPITV